jgi:hypothetical protein
MEEEVNARNERESVIMEVKVFEGEYSKRVSNKYIIFCVAHILCCVRILFVFI